MKQLQHSLLSLMLLHSQLVGEEPQIEVPKITRNDHKALKHLYLLDKKSSLKIKEIDSASLDYYFCTVYDHTQILKHKIEIKKNGWSSSSFLVGLFFATVGGISTGCLAVMNKLRLPDKLLLGLFSTYLPLSLPYFYKAAHYQQRLARRLKRNKRIFRLLQTEWNLRHSSTN